MLQRGEHVGPYVICDRLAIGASSEVYTASADAQLVALKILREDKQHEPLLPCRMANEALALSRIRHPGVVTIFSHDVYQGRPYLALELLCCSLAQSLPVSPRRAVSLAASLARTLAALHAAGIIHRDLKPQNVMLTDDNQPKLVDFGLAKLPVAAATSEAPLIPLSTEPETFLGTYEYAAPEQIVDAKQVNGRSDVYALGVMLFEMLAGRRPFIAKERGRLVSMHLNDPPPRLSLLTTGLPPALVALVARMLDKKPDARPDAAEVAVALEAVHFTVRHSRRAWLHAIPLLLLPLYPAPAPRPMPLDSVLERHYSRFEVALFTTTVAEASVYLHAAAEAMVLFGPAQPSQRARFRYKEAALAKERGAINEALQLFEDARAQWQVLVASQPGKAYKALSICTDGIAEMYYHLGDDERALRLYQDAAHTLPRTLAAAQSNRQVPSFIDYQRALVFYDRGDDAAALAALDDAEGHERVLLAQADAAPADRWQLARVLTLRAEIFLGQGNSDGALAAATEAESAARQALARVPHEKRFRLGHLLALERLDEAVAAHRQMPAPREIEPLAGLREMVQSDPANGQWAHALAETLVQRAQRSHGERQRDLAQEVLGLMKQMERHGQWRGDIHLRRWQELAAGLANPRR